MYSLCLFLIFYLFKGVGVGRGGITSVMAEVHYTPQSYSYSYYYVVEYSISQ